MESGSSTFLAGFGLIVLALALMARGPVRVTPPVAQARVGILDLDCAPGAGRQIEAPFGLTLCRGMARTTVRSERGPRPGARIVALEPQSLGLIAGLRPDDVIYQVAGGRVSTGREAAYQLAALPPHETAVINFWRKGLPFLVRLRPGSPLSPAGRWRRRGSSG